MKILKATYYSIENKKKELHINENVLCKIFESAQRSSGKINMDANSLIHYFEMYTPEKISMIKAILQKVFNKENITLGLFVDSFKPTNEKQN